MRIEWISASSGLGLSSEWVISPGIRSRGGRYLLQQGLRSIGLPRLNTATKAARSVVFQAEFCRFVGKQATRPKALA